MISSAIFITNDPEDIPRRAPTDKQMRVISTAEARQLFGTEAERLDGVSVSVHSLLCNNSAQRFMANQWLAYDPKQLYVNLTAPAECF